MKILIAIYSLGYGGAEKQVVMDANALHEKGHHVTVAFAKDGPLNSLLADGVRRYHVKIGNIVLASIKLFFHIGRNQYEILHGHMFWAMKALTFGGWMFRNKIVFNEHGLGVWRKWYHKTVLHIIAPAAHVILNSCDATKEFRITLDGLKPKKLATLYNSFENTLPEPTQPQDAKTKSSKERPFTIGFLGRFDPVKRLHLFIPLVKQLKSTIPNLRCMLVGDGPDREKMVAMIQKEQLEDHFILTGYLLDPWNHLKDMVDVFFMPSLREAFSVTLLECGAAGVPAVAFDVGGNKEIIQHLQTGFIVPNAEIEKVGEHILNLYQEPQERIKMGRAAHGFVTQMFTIEKRIQQLEEIYRS